MNDSVCQFLNMKYSEFLLLGNYYHFSTVWWNNLRLKYLYHLSKRRYKICDDIQCVLYIQTIKTLNQNVILKFYKSLFYVNNFLRVT